MLLVSTLICTFVATKQSRCTSRRILLQTGNTICFFGDATIAANSPVKGYIRPPDSALCLHPRVTVIPTNEWRSTKLCCRCFCPAVVSKSPHRYVSCGFCQKVYNRDTNGAQNILTIGLNELKKESPILQFTRHFKQLKFLRNACYQFAFRGTSNRISTVQQIIRCGCI